jgi:hypothetical protein
MSIIKKWLHSTNPFRRAAARSDENGMKQILYHDAALKALLDANPADADYILWYNRFHPLKEDSNTKYSAFYSVQGAQEGKTVNVNLRLKAIKGQLGLAHNWFDRTAVIYRITNPARFKAIFSNGLQPFRGKKDKIISALSTLSSNIGADTNPLMEVIKAEIDAEYAIINPARITQNVAKKATGISSDALNLSINKALNMQFKNLGREIDKYADDVDMENKIKFCHDLDAVQVNPQKIFTIKLNHPETKEVAVRTLVFNSKLKAKAEGGNVKIYLATTLKGANSNAVEVTDGELLKFFASDFGITDYGRHRFITVVTESGAVISFKLELK